MALDLTTATTTVSALSNLVLVTPHKYRGMEVQNRDGSLSGDSILFHYEGENTVSLNSDITDHFVEDNTSIADQIALRPEIITTRGYIGELNNIVPDTETGLIRAIKDKLSGISAYTPELTIQALNAYNDAFRLYQAAKTAERSVASWKTVNKSTLNEVGSDGLEREVDDIVQTKQAVAFQQFYGYWRSRTLFTVQTPWAIFKNMAIQSLRAIQPEDSSVITDFEVTFKMVRFAETKIDSDIFDPNNASEITRNQGLPEIDSGITSLSDDVTKITSFFGA